MEQISADRLLTLKQVEKTIAFKKVTIYKMIREARFPPKAIMPGRDARWWESEVQQWLRTLKETGQMTWINDEESAA